MIFILQDFVPSGESLRWQAHQTYYQEEGIEVFLRQEVPYNITSNPCYARQVAQLYLAQYPEPQPLHILELGGGNGIFAFNFLRAFEQLAPAHFSQLHYVLSDFSAPMLEVLAEHEAFAQWQKVGTLTLAVRDAQGGSKAQEETQTWDGIIANYLFSTFPTEILCKPGAEWHLEKTRLEVSVPPEWLDFIAKYLQQQNLSAPLAPTHTHRTSFQALYAAQKRVAEALPQAPAETEVLSWLESELLQAWQTQLSSPLPDTAAALLNHLLLQPLHKRLIPFAWEAILSAEQQGDRAPQVQKRFFPWDIQTAPDTHRQLLNKLNAFQPLAYAPDVLDALFYWQSRLSPQGILVCSDKALVASTLESYPQIARHGGTLSHALHWPLYVQALPGCLYTDRAHHAIQTLCYSPQPTEALRHSFQVNWIHTPRHLISHALLEGGQALLQADRMEAAYRSLKEALDARPEDGTLQYFCALCCLSQGQPMTALSILEVPHDDIFALFNRDILKAEAYQATGQYALAIAAYTASLAYGENALTYYQMARCQQALAQTEAALLSLEKAEQLHPEDADTQALKEALLASQKETR